MRLAVEGCCHGELDNIYATTLEAQAAAGIPIDVLLICGDFQAIRNLSDLQSLAVPEKYRQLGGFHRYYSGEKVAPILTIVIGGNHEASNYMWELYHGGWLAPNIYYLGAAGSVLVSGIRITGASGIYKSGDYSKGRFERMPYDRSAIRSVYHTREYDITRLAQLPLLSAFPSIFLSHDWPLEIERYGDTANLIRTKPFFREEIQANTLGSPPLEGLLKGLRPAYWFSAHLHVRFAALFKHSTEPTLHDGRPTSRNNESNGAWKQSIPAKTGSNLVKPSDKANISIACLPTDSLMRSNPDEVLVDDEDFEDSSKPSLDTLIHPNKPIPTLSDRMLSQGLDESIAPLEASTDTPERNPDEIALDEDFEDTAIATELPATTPHLKIGKPPRPNNTEAQATKFLALSKCLPGKDFLQIFDIASTPSSPTFTFDPAWLAVTRAFHPLLSLSMRQQTLPKDATVCKAMIERELEWVHKHVPQAGAVDIASIQQFQRTAPYPGQPGGDDRGPGPWYTNPQTEALCAMLSLENKVNPVPERLRPV